MTKKIMQSRIVRLVKFLFSKEKKGLKHFKPYPIEYSFKVIEQDDYSIRVLIKKNDVPYCQYQSSDSTFYDESCIEPKDISTEEKIMLLEYINKFGKDIDGLTFLNESF